MPVCLAPGTHVLSIPGWQSSPPGHWQTLWEQQGGNAFSRLSGIDWENPDRDAWVAGLDAHFARNSGPLVLLAHSLGALTVIHWAAQSTRTAQVSAAFLVAPPDVECLVRSPRCLHSFAPIPRAPLPFPTLVVGSDNDQYATPQSVSAMAQAWGAEFVSAGPAGHINLASGHGPWPEGEQWFQSFLRLRKLDVGDSPAEPVRVRL